MKKQSKLGRFFLSKPGDSILDAIEHVKMTQAELAVRMGKTPAKISDLISGKEPVTTATALQLEKVLGLPAEFLLQREATYRERLAKIEEEEQLACWIPWTQCHPLKELKKCGYIASGSGVAAVRELLMFYGVAAPEQWETVYVPRFTQARFRKSEAHQQSVASITAWLRIGEVEMRKKALPVYDKEGFKALLAAVRTMVAASPAGFHHKVQQACESVGVAVVYSPCLPNAPINGAARWIGDNPLIQITDRYKTMDHFWFTFYHEAGHVLLHGKKEVFLEEVEHVVQNEEKEEEANRFAHKWLLPERFEGELSYPLDEEVVLKIAAMYDTHPGIVVGRLQRMKKLEYWQFNGLKERLVLFS